DVKVPIVSAPMYYASTPELASAVTSAGGFGFIAAGFETTQALKQQLQTVRTNLNIPAGKPIPAGVGLLGWILDMTKSESSNDSRITAILEEMPIAIWFAFGTDLGKYIAQVRAYDAKRTHKTIIFVIVNSVADATRAANEWKVDVLVVQGIEAGGHGGERAPPLLNLLQSVISAIPHGPVIIGAGGISTGAQIAALLTLGADGVVLGTRFLFTHECMFTDNMKRVLMRADLNATERSHVFDEVNRTGIWPEGIDGRAISNAILIDYRAGLGLEERLKKYDEGKAKGEEDRLVIWAGVGAGHVQDIRNASVSLWYETVYLHTNCWSGRCA
ncbi:2-nitropropane dioxygenase, partial [Crucibulum laeve]